MLAIEWTKKHQVCEKEFLKWLQKLPKNLSMTEVWYRCMRSDWLIWMIILSGGATHHDFARKDQNCRLLACEFSERALTRELKAGREPDSKSWFAISVAREYIIGKATDKDLEFARVAAMKAANAVRWRDARSIAFSLKSAEDAVCAFAETALINASKNAKRAAWHAAIESTGGASRRSIKENIWQCERIRSKFIPTEK